MNMVQLTPAQLILALVGATGFGSLLSFIFSLIGQALERRARIKELLLSKSVDMAQKTTALLIEISDPGRNFYPEIVTARWYHRQLSRLYAEGKISEDLEKEFHDYINTPHSELDRKMNAEIKRG